MVDPFPWSINLGRWAGTQVRVHVLLVLFVGGRLLDAALFPAKGQQGPFLETAAWLALLLLALALHELGHAAMARRLGSDQDEVRLWPLGNLAGPPPGLGTSPVEGFLIALAGPVTSLGIALITGIGLGFADAQMVFNPFGGARGGAPMVRGIPAESLSTLWWIGWFGYLNWVLFLANMVIPAPPMDGGRMFRAAMANPGVGPSKDGLIGPWTARTSAVVLLLGGLARLLFYKDSNGGLVLIGLAILIELMVRAEARMLEEGGYFEDSVFGYDFSEGYTSLEGSVPKVRPYREGVLKRWRRRRSEARRQRQQAREAAEERRMDEILEKLHRQGRASLTDEEQRFLVRVSAKYRNRSKH